MIEERREGMSALARQIAEIRQNQEDKYLELSTRLDANTELTKKIEERTAGVVEMFSALQGGFKVLGILGQIGKWVAYIAGAVTAIAAALHLGNGIRPK